MTTNYPAGSAHGRFQPFHNGHLEYLLAAFEKADFIWIGITQYNIRELARTDNDIASHRGESTNNPFTYWQRMAMITGSLIQAGIEERRFAYVPFPIERPDLLTDFLDLSIPIFTTVYDKWNRHKVQILRERGFEVIVLWERDTKQFEGAHVRTLIRNQDAMWRKLVPPFVFEYISELQRKDI